jgi:flagellar FliL protein
MAEEKKNEELEGEASAGGKKSNSMMLIIIIVVLILVILIGAIVAILMMGGDSKAEGKEPEAKEKKEEGKKEEKAEEKKSEKGAEGEKKLEEIANLFPLEPFTVNLLSENGSHYLKATLSLALSGKELAAELEEKKAVLRDVILRILSSKSLEEVSTLKGKEKVKEQIIAELNGMLKDGSITGVYFTDFVIQ